MKLAETFEYKGYWWLPSEADNKIAGVLSYKPGKGITLELIGSFGKSEDAVLSFIRRKDEPVIHGQLENAKKVTLLKCYPAGSINFSCSFPIIRYSCIYCFIGRLYKNMNDEGLYKMAVHFPELSYWCHPGLLRETLIDDKEHKGQIISLSFEATLGGKLIDKAKLEDGINIELKAGASFYGDYAKLNNEIGQSSWIELSCNNKISFKKLLSCVYKFEEFLSVATLREVEVSEITIYDEDYYQEIDEDRRICHPIYFFSDHWRGKDTGKVDSISFLFDYDAIKERFGELLKAWFEDRNDMFPVRSNLVDSLEKKRVFSNMDFLILARALDGYCIRSRYKGSLYNRMNTVLNNFSDVLRIQQDSINVDELVDSRNYYAHFMPRANKKNVLDGFELHALTQKVRRLVICCVLSDLGLDNAVIDTILRKSNSKYISD